VALLAEFTGQISGYYDSILENKATTSVRWNWSPPHLVTLGD